MDPPIQDAPSVGGPSSWVGLFLGSLGDLSCLGEETALLEDHAIQKEVDVEAPSWDVGRVALLWGLEIDGRAALSSFQEDHEEGKSEGAHDPGTHPESNPFLCGFDENTLLLLRPPPFLPLLQPPPLPLLLVSPPLPHFPLQLFLAPPPC